jgi:hypothetical protein
MNAICKALMKSIPILLLAYEASATQGYGYGGGTELPNTYSKIIDAQDHGVIANDGLDDAQALQAIIDHEVVDSEVALTLIQLPEGVINLGDEIHVDKSGLVIKGAGSDPQSGTSIVVSSWSPYGVDSSNAPDFDKKYWPGFGAFRVESRQKHPNEQAYEGSINFHWKHSIEFGNTANIGDTSVQVESGKADKFSPNDLIYIGAATDAEFLDLGQVPESRRNATHLKTGHMRTQLFKVASVNNATDTITLDRPLEFSIPIKNESGYNSRAMPVTAIVNFGLQDFHLTMSKEGTACEAYNEQAVSSDNPMGVLYRYENVCPQDAIHGIILKWVQNGWVDNVQIEMMGSHPIVTEFAKDITISNNTIRGSWNKGAGGNGYVRGSKLYNSWIKDNDVKDIRHLALQWSATGNVVERNYLNVDLNLHGGWERNNVIRSNTIEVPFEHRSWANGAPEEGSTWQPIWIGSGDHASKWSGPTGPYNVFIDNMLSKATTESNPIARWNLFDQPGIAYAFNWDGEKYQHINVNGAAASTWNQQIAQDVYALMPSSGVVIIDPENPNPDQPEEPVDPIEPPAEIGCSSFVDYEWLSKLEVTISRAQCVRFDRDLSGKNLQVWDSDLNDSCDFRGNVESVDGSGTLFVASNYTSTKNLTGNVIRFSASNSCDFVKIRAY